MAVSVAHLPPSVCSSLLHPDDVGGVVLPGPAELAIAGNAKGSFVDGCPCSPSIPSIQARWHLHAEMPSLPHLPYLPHLTVLTPLPHLSHLSHLSPLPHLSHLSHLSPLPHLSHLSPLPSPLNSRLPHILCRTASLPPPISWNGPDPWAGVPPVQVAMAVGAAEVAATITRLL
ncbi:unnamed protein product [Closterium sp. Naga37s-1]|nr:unnamed protein product [Closterium sp. Naga37s-1]